MKKFLSIISALGMTATASTAVVSCGSEIIIKAGNNNENPKETTVDLGELKGNELIVDDNEVLNVEKVQQLIAKANNLNVEDINFVSEVPSSTDGYEIGNKAYLVKEEGQRLQKDVIQKNNAFVITEYTVKDENGIKKWSETASKDIKVNKKPIVKIGSKLDNIDYRHKKGFLITVENAKNLDDMNFSQYFNFNGEIKTLYIHINNHIVTYGVDASMTPYILVTGDRAKAYFTGNGNVGDANKPTIGNILIWN